MASYARTYTDPENESCHYTGRAGVFFVEEDGNGGYDVFTKTERAKDNGTPLRRFPAIGWGAHSRACEYAQLKANGRCQDDHGNYEHVPAEVRGLC